MSNSGTFASLTPTLLARKGGAKPAMRRQFKPVERQDGEAPDADDALGWNDLGEPAALEPSRQEAEIVPIGAGLARGRGVPEVVRQQEALPQRVAENAPKARRSAIAESRRAAFTLRLDAERHLDLRMACTVTNRSAQQLVIEALDRLLNDMPEVAELAEQVRMRRG